MKRQQEVKCLKPGILFQFENDTHNDFNLLIGVEFRGIRGIPGEVRFFSLTFVNRAGKIVSSGWLGIHIVDYISCW